MAKEFRGNAFGNRAIALHCWAFDPNVIPCLHQTSIFKGQVLATLFLSSTGIIVMEVRGVLAKSSFFIADRLRGAAQLSPQRQETGIPICWL